jgi:hypothetical protein
MLYFGLAVGETRFLLAKVTFMQKENVYSANRAFLQKT